MAVIRVSGYSSVCSDCGGNCDPHERSHVSGGPNSMWSGGSALTDKNGCGVAFTHHVGVYFDITDPDGRKSEESFKKMFWKDPEG